MPAILTNLEIDEGPFTAMEFATVKSTLKQGKSAGLDGIPTEVPKNCDLGNIILEICNQALIDNINPGIWSLSLSLTCVIAKMYNCMILHWIRDAIDLHLRDNQNGFREDHRSPDPGLKENH